MDNGRYEVRCQAGHAFVVVLRQQKFEILFEIGAHAILDSYYREAVVSFSSCLERTYEFMIRVYCRSNGLTFDTVDATWKHMARMSERQLGAFVLGYTNLFGRPPQLLHGALTELRNDVVHKGKFPSREEAIEYGQAVLTCVRSLLAEAKDHSPNAVDEIVDHNVKIVAIPESDQVVDMQLFILSLSKPDDQTTLQEHLVPLAQSIPRVWATGRANQLSR